MEITSFRDLWGFCRERAGGEAMVFTVDGRPASLDIKMDDGGIVRFSATSESEQRAAPINHPSRQWTTPITDPGE